MTEKEKEKEKSPPIPGVFVFCGAILSGFGLVCWIVWDVFGWRFGVAFGGLGLGCGGLFGLVWGDVWDMWEFYIRRKYKGK